jgi:hypothetical protein
MKPRLPLVCLTLVVALLASGCVPPEIALETATATAAPATATTLPATVTTAPPTPTLAPDSTETVSTGTVPPPATATAAPVEASATVAATPTADPAQEVILLLAPGTTSAVTSPVHVAGEADSTFEQNLVIQVTDQDGAVLATMPTTIQSEMGTRGPFAADVDFSVAADQPGRISVYSASARDGGLVHLASVEVTLLAAGTASILPAAPHDEVHQIFSPGLLESVTGGSVHVTGFSEYVFESTLSLALCGEGGSGAPDLICGTVDNLIASGTALIEAPEVGQPGPFDTDLSYAVGGPTRARLVVYSLSARDGGILHLSSVEISIAP